jgi:predicted MFS family arabinose efflux permease
MISKALTWTGGDRHYVLSHAVAQLLFWSGLYYLFPALMPRIAERTGWSDIGLSAALTIGFLAWAGLSPLAGLCIDRGHGAPLMKGAGIAGAALLMVLATTGTETVAYACLVLLGIPMAMTLYDPCFALILRRFGSPAVAGRAINTVTLVAGFSTFLTFPATAALLASGADWRQVTVMFAFGVLAAAIIVPSRKSGQEKRESGRGLPGVWAGPRLIVLGTAFALVIMAHTVLLFQVPALLGKTWPGETARLLPMVLGPAQVAGRLLWGRIQTWIPLGTSAIWLFALLLVPPMLLWLGKASPEIVLLALVLQGAGYGIQTILRPMLVAAWLPGNIGGKLGTVAMIGLVLMGLGPLAGSTASQLGGFGAVIGLAGGAVALGLVCVTALSRTVKEGGQPA